MTDKLAILICTASAERPELYPTPLVHALAAHALDAEVEIHLAGPAVRLLVDGVADGLYPMPAREKSIGEFLGEVIAENIPLFACSMARAAWIADSETLIPQARAAGATAFIARTLDPAWRTLVY
ncbi:DsrE family protein [Dechloromonas sp. XY25]|uniref:DsrE family protein n=1 Tax=Dechloromonas hankyongensis TaxID=2908002 RepID=A0ABS9K2K8_9RHOO|nr:DsrE family protein [Dechloromonas hankyongensis]MCG2577397.1 DsrE family protein [Dechloromonas hankyongensis]